MNNEKDEIGEIGEIGETEHTIPNEDVQVLDEDMLKQLGFDAGDIEMLGMLKDIDPVKCNMEIIKQNYMDITQGRTGQSNLSIEAIMDSDSDVIAGTDIVKHKLANDVLTLMIDEIIGSGVSMGGSMRGSMRGNPIRKKHNKKRNITNKMLKSKRKRKRTNKRRLRL